MSIYVTIYIVYNLFIKRYEEVEVEERLEGEKEEEGPIDIAQVLV